MFLLRTDAIADDGGSGSDRIRADANLIDYWKRVIAFLDAHVKSAGGPSGLAERGGKP